MYYRDDTLYNTLNSRFIGYPIDTLYPVANCEPQSRQSMGISAPMFLGPSPYVNNYIIDYIKIYNLKLSGTGGCSNIIDTNVVGFNASTFKYKLFHNITLTGTATYGSNVYETLRAENDISISGSFSVPVGSSLLLLQTKCK